jgi:hypothetical protein
MKTKKLEDRQFAPPAGLSANSAALWRSLVPRRCRSAERLTLLRQALLALDRADDYDRRLEGVDVLTKTPAAAMPHVHPMVKLAADARKEWRTLWLALHLDADTVDRMIDGAWEKQDGLGLPTPEQQNALLRELADQSITALEQLLEEQA